MLLKMNQGPYEGRIIDVQEDEPTITSLLDTGYAELPPEDPPATPPKRKRRRATATARRETAVMPAVENAEADRRSKRA